MELVIGVAALAVRLNVPAPRYALVLDLQMAALAFDLMFGNVVTVNECGVMVTVQALPLEMTVFAVFHGYGAQSQSNSRLLDILNSIINECQALATHQEGIGLVLIQVGLGLLP